MAHTEYTGMSMALAWNSIDLSHIKSVSITETAPPAAEDMDTTSSPDAAYVFTPDPLGGKGESKTSVTVVCEDSAADFTDAGLAAQDLADSGALAFEADSVNVGSDTFDHAAMRFQKRTTRIRYAGQPGEVEYLFEADSEGTWGTST